MIKVEKWNEYEIRFVEKDGEWWAVLADVCKALDLKTYHVKDRLEESLVSTDILTDANGRPHEYLIVNEFGIYDTIWSSRKPEAQAFKKWTYSILKLLREASGLEGFKVFRQLDEEYQKDRMTDIKVAIPNATKKHYCKANTIANKAVSLMHGLKKTIKKADMTPEMLKERQPILDDTVQLMTLQEKFNVDISVSKTIYDKYAKENA